MQCEMCGKELEKLDKGIVEGITMDLCQNCMRYAKPAPKKPASSQGRNRFVKRQAPKVLEMESTERVVDDFAEIIKNKRESLQMPQKAFAKRLAEKESVVHSIETGKHEPPVSLAKRIERLLGVKLVVKEEKDSTEKLSDYVKKSTQKGQRSDKMTLGDMISIRKRK
ncbi:MAG: multiprotein bridging factor aMBF1 [Candidatus Woesearchaeota archaeon]